MYTCLSHLAYETQDLVLYVCMRAITIPCARALIYSHAYIGSKFIRFYISGIATICNRKINRRRRLFTHAQNAHTHTRTHTHIHTLQ